ncbi:hypothetical protein BCR43DRAFT_484323 [Syncephalastrum racemosum]|uniref:Uncharacterized protein n=1 Tax=Syncephalastrum racemosum TaxID=13706 RepID=A0A1X2HWQ7_SYNRA|nr:hypothetical protein BCR43DRAFT_484323 [Syncephalastrum racemosum]
MTEVVVNDKMQKDYHYIRTKPVGDEADDFHQHGFQPELTPKEMLASGVFEGKYLNDCRDEFPQDWFHTKHVTKGKPDIRLNKFGIKSRQSLQTWRKNGWIVGDDPRGWFQWYCRYYMGRRTEWDAHQISRWKQFKRHKGQIVKHCDPHDLSKRPKQRQALLQWAYDPSI